METPNICPICNEQKPAEDEYGHCSYACASGGGKAHPAYVHTAHGSVKVTTLTDGRLSLKGYATFECRESIKAAALAAGSAAQWQAAEKCWIVPAGTDLAAALPPPPPPKPKRLREDWTREEYTQWLIRHARRKVFGPCCRFATAYESRPYGPICYRCERHGDTINDYTGD